MIPPDAVGSPAGVARIAAQRAVPKTPSARPGVSLHARSAAMAASVGGKTATYLRGVEVEAAARVSLKLAEVVNEIAGLHRGKVVKMLGDGVHFYFEDPSDAVTASLDLVEDVGSQDLPPAHVGVNAGPMIYDEGDYFGRTVNIAARIASQAGPGQVFVGEDVVRHVAPEGFRFILAGSFELKGVSGPVTLHEVVRDSRS